MTPDEDDVAGVDPTPEEHRRRTPVVVVLLACVALAVVAVGGFLLWPRGASEITTEDAVAGFREEAAGEGSADSPDTSAGTASGEDAGRSTPTPGVYEYTASGSEQVKFGPLPTEDRPMPDVVTLVVGDAIEDPDGTTCFEWTLNLFEQHTEDTTWCTDGQGTLSLDDHTKHQTIGALSPDVNLGCDPNTLLSPDSDTSSIACRLTLSGGPAQVDAELAATATTGPSEESEVAGATLEATPLSIDYEVSGGLSGTWQESFLLGEDLLPLRISHNLDLDGPATLTESFTLELLSTQPAR